MKNDITICINSSGRPDNVKTLEQFPTKWRRFVAIVVPWKQKKKYRKSCGAWQVVPVDKDCPPYLSSQRQWVMENSKSRFVWFMDDDLSFLYRRPDLRLRKCKEKHMKRMLKAVDAALSEGIPLVGISTQLGNNRCEQDYAEIGRVTRCYVVDKEVFDEVGVSLAPFEPFCMQDFHLTLSFFKAGHKNRILFNYAQADVGGSNAEGGCSGYRTYEVLERVVKWLAKTHSPFVTPKIKYSKTGWEGFPKDDQGRTIRLDANFKWKKAYEYGCSRQSGISQFMGD